MAREIVFAPAVRERIKARVLVFGPSGSGKSYTSLLLASHLAGDEPFGVIDSEDGRARLYADDFNFSQYEMAPPYHPQHYINAIARAEEAGIKVLVIDSITPEWDGTGGVKEIVDEAKGRFGGNQHSAWSVGTPLHNKFIEAILRSKCHIICTARSKTEWMVEEDERGKKKYIKVGLAPTQRDTIEYEFDLCLLMDMENNGMVSKSHAGKIWPPGSIIEKPGADLAAQLKKWLGEGAEPSFTPESAGDEPGSEGSAGESGDELSDAPTIPTDVISAAQETFSDPAQTDQGQDHTMVDAGETSSIPPESIANATPAERVVVRLGVLKNNFGSHPTLNGGTWDERMAERIKEWYRADSIADLTQEQYEDLDEKLRQTIGMLGANA